MYVLTGVLTEYSNPVYVARLVGDGGTPHQVVADVLADGRVDKRRDLR